MKKTFTIAMVLLFYSASSQIYTPMYPTAYGNKVNRQKQDSVLHIPFGSDTLLRTNDTTPQIRVINGELKYYSGIWKNASGGGISGNYVDLTTNQTIGGTKTFSDNPKILSNGFTQTIRSSGVLSNNVNFDLPSINGTAVISVNGTTANNFGNVDVDTLVYSTRSWRQKGIDSVVGIIPQTSSFLRTEDSTIYSTKANATKQKDSVVALLSSISVDTFSISTRDWRQKGIDSLTELITTDFVPYTGANKNVNIGTNSLVFSNYSELRKGTYDYGGQGGISQICSVGYENNWQSGINHIFDNNGFIRNSQHCFNIIPDNSFDETLRFKVGSIWTLDDKTSYICTDATTGSAVWSVYNPYQIDTSNFIRYSDSTIYSTKANATKQKDSVVALLSNVSATRLTTAVYNNSGSTITKGSVVYINGAHSSVLPTVALAKANAEETSAYTYGLVETDISNNSQGTVIQSGVITNLNLPTSTYTDGQTLYLSPTVAGGYTLTKPLAPNHYVAIGTITRAHPTLGTIQIAIRNGFQLDEMSDVSIALVPIDSTILQFSRVDSLWHDVNPTTAMGNRFVKRTDSSSMLSPYLRKADTTTLSNRINLKQNTISSGTYANMIALSSPTAGQQFFVTDYIPGLYVYSSFTSDWQYQSNIQNVYVNQNFTTQTSLSVFQHFRATIVTGTMGAGVTGDANAKFGSALVCSSATVTSGTILLQGNTTGFGVHSGSKKHGWIIRLSEADVPTASEDFNVIIGTTNNANGVPMIGFTAHRSYSNNWTAISSTSFNASSGYDIGGTTTYTNTGVAINSGYNEFVVLVDEAAPSVKYYINGTLVATHTTNIPASGAAALLSGGIFRKIAGSTNRSVRFDYLTAYVYKK